MAIFGWGKSKDKGGEDGGNGSPSKLPAIEFSPEKARAWFDRARVTHDSGNFEYAMTCWLSGLRFAPADMEAFKSFFNSAQQFGKPPTKDMVKAVNVGKTDVDRYLTAILQWSCSLFDADLAITAAVASAELGLSEPAAFIAPRALDVLSREKKPKKQQFIKLMDVFEKTGNFDLAYKAGDAAYRMDPSDSDLSAHVRNLTAQSAVSKGGYDKTGEAGGFRSNIRDSDKQRKLEEEERITKSTSTIERVVESTRAEYLANTMDKPIIGRYVKALLERGTPDDERAAFDVLMKAFADTQEFRFRQSAGEIKIRQARRNLKPFTQAVEANPSETTAKDALAAEQKKLLELEISEFETRAKAYPTDLQLKYELGRRYIEAARHNDAIDLLQQAKSDVRNKVPVLNALGQAFQAISWHDEAIETFRQALEGLPEGNETMSMDLKYGLLVSLQHRAEESRELPAAEEAYKLASAIAAHQFSFKDVRARRDTLKGLISQLKQPTG